MKIKTQEMYEVDGLLKFCEEDIYNEGCMPETGFTFNVDVKFKADTQNKLIEEICEFLGIEKETKEYGKNYEINSCDENGRVDFFTLENGDGYNASQNEYDLWKKGKTKLYSCVYTAYVEKVIRTKEKLTE